jgi:hypothetical protein
MAADRDSYRILDEKAFCANKNLPPGYSVTPDARARFYDPTNPDCPALPVPRPVLYGYQLPTLVSDQAVEVQMPLQKALTPADREQTNSLHATVAPALDGSRHASSVTADGGERQYDEAPLPSVLQTIAPFTSPMPCSAPPTHSPVANTVVPVGFLVQVAPPAEMPPTTAESIPVVANVSSSDEENAGTVEPAPATSAPILPPTSKPPTSMQQRVAIPEKAWSVLPNICIDRMMEFESLRTEYSQTFAGRTRENTLTGGRRLTLANLMELAVINSREYQTRKEILYRAALAVTRRRYQFDLNPTTFGNGTAANYQHTRTAGTEVNRLAIPTGVGVQQTLASGGEFLARFANSVVLTFNGPSGFAADVGSEMIFDFQQTVFQRDVRFENLTQAERDVIYAVRDYLRFRKQLFRDVANQYYNLLVSFRTIEINARDYFTNLRGFLQTQAEYRTAEKIPRIQVDQFEQNVLRSRSNLVNNVFALESALDLLKFRVGLPTEMVVQLDLTELQSISLKDELSVARQMINRTRAELNTARESRVVDATSLANVAEVLTSRMVDILGIQKRMQSADPEFLRMQPSSESIDPLEAASQELEDQQQLLRILGARMQVDILRGEFETQVKAEVPVPPLRILIRAIEFSSAELAVIDLALESRNAANDPLKFAELQRRRAEFAEQLTNLAEFLDRISSKLMLDTSDRDTDEFSRIPERMKESIELVKKIETLGRDATFDLLPADEKSVEGKVKEAVDRSIELSDRLLLNGPDGWTDIQVDQNEAMLTGLVQRLDLMNQRGNLADAWRQIKLAGDDLRSIVDLRATQVLGTKSTGNDPFDFTFDDSETRLSVALDTPLNRRLQRNNFRVALINYNVGLRNLIAAEDSIKLDVREDLRQLALDRNQYGIAVASAALAYERVISTRLRLQLSVQNVAARDFLESQQAYTNALNSIARLHINYIIDRLELFFDLEAFDVDQLGNWAGVGEDYGPGINLDFPKTNPRPYDCLPSRIWYSPTIRHMEHIPPGDSIIHQSATSRP